MDNFIDKLAQKFTAGEVIRANSVAEEKELKRLREQVAEYERCLQEMRKIQMRNTETAQNLQELMAESKTRFEQMAQESLAKISEAGDQAESKEAEAKQTVKAAQKAVSQVEAEVSKMNLELESVATALGKNQKEISEWFKQADDFLHKENVKVYRNVQAVVVEELGNKTESILNAQETNTKKYSKPALIFAVLTFLVATAGLIVQILSILGLV